MSTNKPTRNPWLNPGSAVQIIHHRHGELCFYHEADEAIAWLKSRIQTLESCPVLEAPAERLQAIDNLQPMFDVAIERARQDGKWGGAARDDTRTPMDWHEIIADYNGWARRMMTMNSPDKARRRYIQIAALAIAAVESLDRKTAAAIGRAA